MCVCNGSYNTRMVFFARGKVNIFFFSFFFNRLHSSDILLRMLRREIVIYDSAWAFLSILAKWHCKVRIEGDGSASAQIVIGYKFFVLKWGLKFYDDSLPFEYRFKALNTKNRNCIYPRCGKNGRKSCGMVV